jgi:hypothetical protein
VEKYKAFSSPEMLWVIMLKKKVGRKEKEVVWLSGNTEEELIWAKKQIVVQQKMPHKPQHFKLIKYKISYVEEELILE